MGGREHAVYVYAWGNNPKRAALKGRRCVIRATGSMRSCMVRFLDDGSLEIVSRRALRREPGEARPAPSSHG